MYENLLNSYTLTKSYFLTKKIHIRYKILVRILITHDKEGLISQEPQFSGLLSSLSRGTWA